MLGLVIERAFFLHELQQENRRMQQIAGRFAAGRRDHAATPAC